MVFPQRSVNGVVCRLNGARNGLKIGRELSTAQKDAEKINDVCAQSLGLNHIAIRICTLFLYVLRQ